MNALDMAFLLLLLAAAIRGFLRGFLFELVTLAGGVVGLMAVSFGQAAFSAWLAPWLGNAAAATVLAVALLFALGYGAVRLSGHYLRQAAHAALLGPVDRMLGAGFGIVKGVLVATLIFLLFTLGHDLVFLGAPRPAWLREARCYPLLRTTGEVIVDFVEARRRAGQTRPVQTGDPPS